MSLLADGVFSDNLHDFGSLALSEGPMEFDAGLIPFTLFLVALLGLSIGLILLGHLCGPHRSNPVKAMPYESGVDPFHDAHRRFHVGFHVLAVAFLVFDVELLFLYPWVVSLRQSANSQHQASIRQGIPDEKAGQTAVVPVVSETYSSSFQQTDKLAGVGVGGSNPVVRPIFWPGFVFFVLLAVGYIYDWRRRVFDWS